MFCETFVDQVVMENMYFIMARVTEFGNCCHRRKGVGLERKRESAVRRRYRIEM